MGLWFGALRSRFRLERGRRNANGKARMDRGLEMWRESDFERTFQRLELRRVRVEGKY